VRGGLGRERGRDEEAIRFGEVESGNGAAGGEGHECDVWGEVIVLRRQEGGPCEELNELITCEMKLDVCQWWNVVEAVSDGACTHLCAGASQRLQEPSLPLGIPAPGRQLLRKT
jgi:hypothetical protein